VSDDEKLANDVFKELCRRLGKRSIFALPWISQVVMLVVNLQGTANNGGFIYFFEADWPGNPPYSVFGDALRAIGADESADCVEVAATLFPFKDPHLNCIGRKKYLREHCMIGDLSNNSATLVKLGDRVIDNNDKNYALLAKYIRKHLSEIQNQ
jgi:hypothetical protein